MGRGLSDLQRWILQEVQRLGYLHNPDICVRYFGWQPTTRPMYRYGEGHWANDTREPQGQLVNPCGRYFNPDVIGIKEYRRVLVTINRSCQRLERRGLVRWLGGVVTKYSESEQVRELEAIERSIG